jgi:hypothetical protein
MATLSGRQIQDLAIDLIKANPTGIRYSELVARIQGRSPETKKLQIGTEVANLGKSRPNEFVKPRRGLYLPVGKLPNGISSETTSIAIPTKVKEEDFYQPFADWLQGALDEANIAISLGGAGMQRKWSTPDVVGVYKPLPSHRIKFDIELISAEIKVDPSQTVVAFGQAVAYRLFSAKSYIVMPETISEEDFSRLEALCILFGIGLVLFKVNPEEPDFQIRVRAQRYSPDMFYVNEFAERVYQLDVEMFNTLFG